MKNGLIIDCFAGGGGASVGIEMALGRQVDIAVNHDPDAILMHKTNHPSTLHLTEDIFKVDLQKYVKGQHVALMWASPDCTSHSKAKGGKPRKHGLRILPWAVYKHAKTILPDVIIMENVEEIQLWGPLDASGHPIPEKKGEDYKRFIAAMQSLGYIFDSRELVAADFGAPTTRKRWYAVFRRDGRSITWPEPTHSKGGVNGLKPWEPIYKYLDLTDAGRSIFGRKKPLAEKTMNRIARGLGKFVFNNPEPFIVQVNHGGNNFRGQGICEPIPTITQKHGFGIVTADVASFIAKAYGGNYQGCGSDTQEPLHTITTVDHNYLVTPYMMRNNTGEPGSSVNHPMLTITTGGHHGLISPYLIQYHSETTKNGFRGQQATEPIQTIDTSNRYGLIMSYMTKFYKSGTGQSMIEPIHTITTSPGHFGQVSIYAVSADDLLKNKDQDIAGQAEVNDMLQKCTWTSQFIMEYYGCGTGQSINDPLHTIVTKDRFALITVLGNEYVIMDIFLRMLTPEELKMGQGFPEDYVIGRDYNGNKYPVSKQVARIGNSVVPIMAQKLVEANCGYLKVGERQPMIRTESLTVGGNGQLCFA